MKLANIMWLRGGQPTEVKVNHYLDKMAVLWGDVLVVTPAMYELLSNADEKEMAALLEAIQVVSIPKEPLMFAGALLPDRENDDGA